jgi:hypothetical protein
MMMSLVTFYHYLPSTYLTPVCQSKEVRSNKFGIVVRSRNSRSEAASESIDSTRASASVRNEPHRESASEIGRVQHHHHQAYHAKCVITLKTNG